MAAIDELLRLLVEAEALVAGYSTMSVYCGRDSGADFAAELRGLREQVARRDWAALGPLVGIFAPTGAWDEGVGREGVDLADRIMAVLEEMGWSSLLEG